MILVLIFKENVGKSKYMFGAVINKTKDLKDIIDALVKYNWILYPIYNKTFVLYSKIYNFLLTI